MNYLFSKYLLNDCYLLSTWMCVFFHLLNKYLWVPRGLALGHRVMGKVDMVPTFMEFPVFLLIISHKLHSFWIYYFCPNNSPLRNPCVLVLYLPGNNFLIWLLSNLFDYWMFTSYLAQTSTKMITARVICSEFYLQLLYKL